MVERWSGKGSLLEYVLSDTQMRDGNPLLMIAKFLLKTVDCGRQHRPWPAVAGVVDADKRPGTARNLAHMAHIRGVSGSGSPYIRPISSKV